jgi:hypothetical protein
MLQMKKHRRPGYASIAVGLSSFDSGVVARDDGKSMGNFRHQLVGGFNHLEKYYGYSNLEIMVIQIFVV